jgi:replicative DNA helicase
MANRFDKKPNTEELGKLPPQNIEFEEAILGAILIDREAINEVIAILIPEAFYKDAHQKIYRSIIQLNKNNEPIDILTVQDVLRKNKQLDEVGGPAFISYLTNRIASSYHIEFHSGIVMQTYAYREFIRISSDVQRMCYDNESLDEIQSYQDREMQKLMEIGSQNEAEQIGDIISNEINKLEKIASGEIKFTGVPSGFQKIDRITNGWQPSDLIIIAARPSMGKTAFAIALGINASELNYPTAVFSLEMSNESIGLRVLSSSTNYSNTELRSATNLDWKELERSLTKLINLKLFIEDTPSLTPVKLKSKVRRLIKLYGIKQIIIDYLQLMKDPSIKGNREQEVSSISGALKSIAKEFDIPVIALAQLNRAVDSRTDKKPQLSDLRESGSIEQDADVVIFIHRPEKYGIETFEDGSPTKGITQILIQKHRNGATKDIELYNNDVMSRFADERSELTNDTQVEIGNFYDPSLNKIDQTEF